MLLTLRILLSFLPVILLLHSARGLYICSPFCLHCSSSCNLCYLDVSCVQLYTSLFASFVVVLLTHIKFLRVAPGYSITVLTKYLHTVAGYTILVYLYLGVRQINMNYILINTLMISKCFRSLLCLHNC